MTAKTRRCDECQHFDVTKDLTVCSLGHNPRFYRVQEVSRAGGWGGWKRKCEDFKGAEHEPRKP